MRRFAEVAAVCVCVVALVLAVSPTLAQWDGAEKAPADTIPIRFQELPHGGRIVWFLCQVRPLGSLDSPVRVEVGFGESQLQALLDSLGVETGVQ